MEVYKTKELKVGLSVFVKIWRVVRRRNGQTKRQRCGCLCINVNTKFSVLKPIHAQWLIGLYDRLRTGIELKMVILVKRALSFEVLSDIIEWLNTIFRELCLARDWTSIKGSNGVKWKFREFVGNVRKFYGQAKQFLNFAVRVLHPSFLL